MNSFLHAAQKMADPLNRADKAKVYALLAIAEAIFYAGAPQRVVTSPAPGWRINGPTEEGTIRGTGRTDAVEAGTPLDP